MRELVFMVEEPSAREFLNIILPKILSEDFSFTIIKHEGKSDLQKSLPRKLKAFRKPNVSFVVLMDQDGNDCKRLKAELQELCSKGERYDTLVRIVCHELESWFIGDLAAVEEAFGLTGLARKQREAKFRDPDRIGSPSQLLKSIVPEYQKMSGARSIARHMNLDSNLSSSFNTFISGIRRICS